MIKKINHKSVWKSQNIYQENDWIYELSKIDIKELEHALFQYKKYFSQSLNFITKENFKLGVLSQELRRISNYLENDKGIFLLRNFPLNKYDELDLKILFIGLGIYLGQPLLQSIKGEKIYEVIDHGGKLGEARGTATRDPLPFHTDRSDAVGLLCLEKAQEGGQSKVVSASAIHNEMFEKYPELLECLYEDYYHARTNWETNEKNSYYKLPVFSKQDDKISCRYLRHFINESQKINGVPKLLDKQVRALNKLEEISNDPEFCVNLDFEPGDIQFLNNFVTLHSRTGYKDNEEINKKRKLYRLWLSVPNSRRLNEKFMPIFGSVEAGALRGGVIC